MKKHEKEIEIKLLQDEEDVVKKLEETYSRALRDIKRHARELKDSIDKLVELDPDNETLIRSKIYQLDYQKALQKQIEGFLKVIRSDNVKDIEDYMKVMYEDSYYTNIYNLHKKGMPVIVPINQELLIKSLTYDINKIPLSKRIYDNVDDVKKKVIAEISRGISTGMNYQDMGRNIHNVVDVSLRKAKMIAQNEGQRVKTDARIDSMKAAKEKGADIVKVWDCTYDKKTRPVHRELDQQWAELEEDFTYNGDGGGKVFAPKRFGKAHQDINCRCILLSVPRWDIDDTVQKRDNITGELIEAKNYDDWLEKYHKEVEKDVKSSEKVYNNSEKKLYKAYNSAIKSGELSSLADFNLYKKISEEMDKKLIGAVTSNNITIIGKSKHSIARVIGSVEQKRNGVKVSDIYDALTNKDSEILPIKERKNGKSQKFRSKVVEVSINIDTGNIIQVNPVHTGRKKGKS